MSNRDRQIVRAVLGVVMASVVALTTSSIFAQQGNSTVWAYIGTYTQGDSQGIYVAPFDTEAGKFGELQLAAESENPSFLAIHPSGEYLYAVGETGDYQGDRSGFVRSFRIDHETGRLTSLNTQRSGGVAPCHLVVDSTGKTVLVANYGGGNVAAIALQDDGRLGDVVSLEQHVGSSVDAQRQQGPHAHSINLDANNRYALVADLGLDKILVYRFDAESGRLLRGDAPLDATLPPGSGPRHFAFHPNGQFAYVINEMASTINAFRYDASEGSLASIQNVATLPGDFQGNSSTAEIVVHPNGQYVYGSNRGHDSIAVFRVATDTGELSRVQIAPTGGKTPRNFAIDPSGRFLLAENQGSNTIVVHGIDQATGRVSATGEVLNVPVPVCVRFLAHPR